MKIAVLSFLLILLWCIAPADCRQPLLTEKDDIYWILHEAQRGPYSDQALKLYEKAIKLDPSCAQIYEARAYRHQRAGKLDLALADFTKAIQLDPDDEYPWLGRARCHFWQKQYELAIEEVKKYEDLDRARCLHMDHWECSGTCYQDALITAASMYHLGDSKGALQILKWAGCSEGIGATVTDGVYYRALCYMALKDYQSALKDLEHAIEECNYIPEYHLALAKVYATLGKRKLAHKELRAARNVPAEYKKPRYDFM